MRETEEKAGFLFGLRMREEKGRESVILMYKGVCESSLRKDE